MTATMRTLAVENITVRFSGLVAISSVSLSFKTGEILGLIGPNGAGKTTFVNCLSGFQKLSEGLITLDDDDIANWSPAQCRRQGISRTFQASRLFNDMSVLENVEVAGVGLGLSRREGQRRALELLDYLGLMGRVYDQAGSLPYTDQRRLGIARALIMEPAFVLLDEPAAGMSEAECEELGAIVRELPGKFGCGVLLIEHNMAVIGSVCDRVHVLDGGTTLAHGLPKEVMANKAVLAAYLGDDNQ